MAPFSKHHWERFRGKTDWKHSYLPGSGLVHEPCGRAEMRVRFLDVICGGGVLQVGFLYCTRCHEDEDYPVRLNREDLVDKPW